MRLIDNYHANTAIADKMFDVVGEQQLWRKIKQVNFSLTYRPINLHLLLR